MVKLVSFCLNQRFLDKKSEEFEPVKLEKFECPLGLDIIQLTLYDDEIPDIQII